MYTYKEIKGGMKLLLLRPHHINCMFFYRGLGYSEDFNKGMKKIINLLKDNPNTKIKLIVKCDILCDNCPNKQSNDMCITKEKIDKLDFNTLQTYNLNENEEYSFKQILDNIYKGYDKNKFHEICNYCNWYKEGVCNENIIKTQLENWIL